MKKYTIIALLCLVLSTCTKQAEFDFSKVSNMSDGEQDVPLAKIKIIEGSSQHEKDPPLIRIED